MTTRISLLGLSCLSAFALFGCGNPSSLPVIPDGPQTVHGILRAAPLALDRRGTHILSQSGADLLYVESSSLNLRPYEGRTVTIHGLVHRNIDRTVLPVLVAEDIIVHDPQRRLYTSQSLHVRFEIPEYWRSSGSGTSIRFFDQEQEAPIVLLEQVPSAPLPPGTPLVVANRRSIRVADATSGQETIYVPLGENMLVLHFSPSSNPERAAEAGANFIHALTSLVLTAQPESSEGTSSLSTGSGVLLPCGGAAGVLCPQGSYCAITDRMSNVGVCKSLRQ